MNTFKVPVRTEEEERDHARMCADVKLVTSKMAEWRRSLDFPHYDFSSCMETWAWEIRNLKWRMDTGMPLVDVFTNIWYLEWQPSYTLMDDPTYKPDLARWHRSQNLGK